MLCRIKNSPANINILLIFLLANWKYKNEIKAIASTIVYSLYKKMLFVSFDERKVIIKSTNKKATRILNPVIGYDFFQ